MPTLSCPCKHANAQVTEAPASLCSDKNRRGKGLHALGIRVLVHVLVENMFRFVKNQTLWFVVAFPIRPRNDFINVLFDALVANYIVITRINELHGNGWLQLVHRLRIGPTQTFDCLGRCCKQVGPDGRESTEDLQHCSSSIILRSFLARIGTIMIRSSHKTEKSGHALQLTSDARLKFDVCIASRIQDDALEHISHAWEWPSQ
mmetsp:Transcript_94763/g.245271  ORF Transcript_94763/g.245271 Transcript_94763/m.245271 type:complete len:204 (+) Transcript_94763:164-775(+)